MFSAPVSTLSSTVCNFERSLHEGSPHVIPLKHEHISNIISTGHDLERQIYIVRDFLILLYGANTEFLYMNNDEQDELFTMCSIDTVHTSYLAAQSRVRQYTQFVALLQRAEDAWAQKIQEIGCVITEEKLGRVSLDEIQGQVDEQDVLLANTIHMVFANYAAAQCRVRQYTHFLMILRREEDTWLQRFQKACSVMPGYEPVRHDQPMKGDLMKSLRV
ncbi:uncharacterized protein F5891DRAFT_985577 [Suillus fuscotomentosus]|uniref:Uncharacterized protein n=1 Tax=Suillus fuscotomentosus TaxID=1912939 RepID=A0AAD4HFN5_9AGAM|nr:uncharacterized protein F5891DRAFT_985577 [Suillus fuscotomentosus]KAG1893759.1 hypothetical protein F5891DRAFT_985577 [Suillus fuscotomentosus]